MHQASTCGVQITIASEPYVVLEKVLMGFEESEKYVKKIVTYKTEIRNVEEIYYEPIIPDGLKTHSSLLSPHSSSSLAYESLEDESDIDEETLRIKPRPIASKACVRIIKKEFRVPDITERVLVKELQPVYSQINTVKYVDVPVYCMCKGK